MYTIRLLKEQKANANGTEYYYIQPLEDDLLRWHFTFKGLEDTVYNNGLYHGYIQIPQDYPLSPPDIYYLNESGRFSPNTKICLTITSYHSESWSPLWTFEKMVQAMIAHFLIDDSGIGSLKENDNQRKQKAKSSRDYICSHCGPINEIDQKFISIHKKK